ncbi:deoxynucleoside kinase [Candidatus Sulfidibacterium hydrothermale]|uniref:deoxynucleoside kinase n=1 Tax=Candidatus Sulfidibacterium hydrothermale TaxID=2875962 RepID=UPI001F0A0A7A|nr:deoxynucleoside kinase [Candidatus Sulfidibacterium hydrothermale]UBM62035.1 deoxynucleoside kinase [Candidatus Sulfidibacterium hydrothermale]
MQYNFIAIEGNIGAGKTSLATKIAQDYNAHLILEQFEENSFLPKFYKEPEKYAFPLEMSFMAARYQQLKDQLLSMDLFKTFTISDYFIIKSLIFARKNLPPDEFKLYSTFFNIIYQQLPKPELLVYLYVKTDRLQSNIKMRGRPYEQNIQDEYLDKIQEGYFEFIRQQKNLRILILDTNKLDFVNRPEDYQKILDVMERSYPTGIHRITF